MNIHPAIAICIPFLMGFVCSYLAQKRGRGWAVWFLVGFIFGLIGTLVLYILPNKANEKGACSSDS